ELEAANVFVRARGNLSLQQKDDLLTRAGRIVLETPGIQSAFAFAREGGLSTRGPGGGAGSAEQLVDYVRPAHDAVKAEDAAATFVMGGIAAFNLDVLLVARDGRDIPVRQSWSATSETVLTRADMRGAQIAGIIDGRVLPVLRRAPFDMASVHLYGPEARDAARIALIERLSGKPVLSSECGGPTLDYGGRYTEADHFRAVIERNLNVLAAGARFCLWFRLGESGGASYGNRRTALYTPDAKAKPGVYAYRALARLIGQRTRVAVVGPGHYELRGEGDGRVTIAWGNAAGALRGADGALCLADAARGRLSADPGACPDGAMTFAGPDVPALLATR
ncbi:hypothetical protein, partial [Jannaschia sp. LMIT008]|uniref:hypothetical protein n=1 Tax=Jannaschia maritima TaxID=3032585 RepID=UPI002810D5A0